MAYQDPKRWLFNPADHEAAHNSGAFWAMPARLVTDGTWATLWKPSRSAPGGGIATAVLSVLATHVFPEMRLRVVHDVPADDAGEWTPWFTLPYRQIAALAGMSKDSVATGFRQLAACGLLEHRRSTRRAGEGGYQTQFRVAASCYARGGEPFARIEKRLLYGGVWAMLPTHGCHHLYGVIAALDALVVRSESALASAIAERHDMPEEEEVAAELRRKRHAHPMSLATLQGRSGMSLPAVTEALGALQVPYVDPAEKIGLVKSGDARGNSRWYAPNERAWGYHYSNWDFLNRVPVARNVTERQRTVTVMVDTWREEQGRHWPKIAARWTSAVRVSGVK